MGQPLCALSARFYFRDRGLFEAGSLDRSKDEARAASGGRTRPFLMIYVNKVENLAGGPTRGPPPFDVVRLLPLPLASGSRTSSILIPLVATPTPASLVRTVFDLGILLVFRRSCLLRRVCFSLASDDFNSSFKRFIEFKGIDFKQIWTRHRLRISKYRLHLRLNSAAVSFYSETCSI